MGENEIRLEGSEAALLSAAAEAKKFADNGVPGSVQEWRREKDSNLTFLKCIFE